jgi:hypothetical protein
MFSDSIFCVICHFETGFFPGPLGDLWRRVLIEDNGDGIAPSSLDPTYSKIGAFDAGIYHKYHWIMHAVYVRYSCHRFENLVGRVIERITETGLRLQAWTLHTRRLERLMQVRFG